MNKTTEALKLAEEALESCEEKSWSVSFNAYLVDKALAAIREALTEPVKQEPVKMMNSVGNTEAYLPGQQTSGFDIPLYAAPVQPMKQEPVAWENSK